MNILLHICCGNCALYPVKILRSEGINMTGFWFNPNIHPLEEYRLRIDSLKYLSDKWHFDMLYDDMYRPEEYFNLFQGDYSSLLNDSGGAADLNVPELPPFPERCRSCYLLRLEKTAAQAKEQGFDAFTTTLLISPYQDFEQIRKTGTDLAEKYNIDFFLKDFRPWFRDAMNLSKELELYRQNYCGCIFSREERNRKKPKQVNNRGTEKNI